MVSNLITKNSAMKLKNVSNKEDKVTLKDIPNTAKIDEDNAKDMGMNTMVGLVKSMISKVFKEEVKNNETKTKSKKTN